MTDERRALLQTCNDARKACNDSYNAWDDAYNALDVITTRPIGGNYGC